jgi:DNA-binding MarR family transcriptional regulator
MNGNANREQAKTIASLLFAVIRRLTAVDHDPVEDLPLAQLRVCGVLYAGPRPMSALSRDLGVSLSALTQIADRLERAELVERVAEGPDRRVRRLKLTPQGEKIMRRREEVRTRRMAAALAGLSPRGRQEVRAALEMLRDACTSSKEQEIPLSTSKALL